MLVSIDDPVIGKLTVAGRRRLRGTCVQSPLSADRGAGRAAGRRRPDGTTFLDSTGLGVLVSGAKRAPRGSLAIVCDDESMTRVFAIVGLDRIFSMFASRAAALAKPS